MISAVAEFWCSRVEWSPEEENYHLRGEGMGGRWSKGGKELGGGKMVMRVREMGIGADAHRGESGHGQREDVYGGAVAMG